MRRAEHILLRLLAVALLAPALAACSVPDFSSAPKFGGLPRFESLSVASAPDSGLAQGGIALQMTECEVVKRAGTPENVQVGTNVRGERTVTLTYNSGPRPGIYHFSGGRLYDIDRVEAPPEPPKPAKPKKPAAKKPA